MFLQLGVSIFLIVGSMVIRRQVNYSLLKEPGRNYDQVVYLNYPGDLTNEDLLNMRETWKKFNPNIIDVMATSQLPNRISSKEVNSEFYFMLVDRGFNEFFQLEMVAGNWFKPNDGDSIMLVNELGNKKLTGKDRNVIGVFKDLGEQFNQPEKPVKIMLAPYFNYNFLCIRILEVNIRSTVHYLEKSFEEAGQKPTISFLNRRFEQWLAYQDKLNTLSEVLAVISGILSCCAIYGLSISIVRDKLKQIAIHKLCGANGYSITRILVKEFANQLLMAILVFGPITYLVLQEILRTFVYRTSFTWLDPIIPLAYCVVVITMLCGFQTFSLNRKDFSSALKG
jgi:putative ABC transport system permease protein